jgi:beta-lactamase superfamily II metal-dependent hydrolase
VSQQFDLRPGGGNVTFGQPNRYGHPNPNALAELDGVGAQTWRTDQHGTITITFTDQGPVVASER